MVQPELPEAQRAWGKRSTTIRDKVADTLRGKPALLEHTTVILQALPVPPQEAEKKQTLVRDLIEASKEWEALMRSVDLLADRLKDLPVENVPSQGIRDEGMSQGREEAVRAFTRLREVLHAQRVKEQGRTREKP